MIIGRIWLQRMMVRRIWLHRVVVGRIWLQRVLVGRNWKHRIMVGRVWRTKWWLGDFAYTGWILGDFPLVVGKLWLQRVRVGLCLETITTQDECWENLTTDLWSRVDQRFMAFSSCSLMWLVSSVEYSSISLLASFFSLSMIRCLSSTSDCSCCCNVWGSVNK